jgi:pimeloyl-ACP methyl ester carboxylesterase
MVPILLLHGALGASSQLEPLKLLLEASGRQLYTLNFSGHGANPFKENFGIEEFAFDILNFIDESSFEQVDIFGYSMGGYVALWLAYEQPSRVRKIATLGTKFDWSVDSANHEVKKLNPEKIIEKVPAFARLLETRHAPNNWKELMSKTSDMMLRLGAQPLLSEDKFQGISHPVHIMLGDSDDMADRRYSEKVADLIPDAKFQLLENTPHPIEKVEKEKLAKTLLQFFID